MPTPHVAFLAPEVFPVHREFVRGLKEAGARVTGIGHTARERLDAGLLGLMDRYEAVGSMFDANQVAGAARRADAEAPLDRLEATDESLVLAAARARELLGLPGLSVRTVILCRDKPEMKQALRAAGVACAESIPASTMAEVVAFVDRVGYPVVLKPRAALGSLGTYRADHAGELEAAARALSVGRGTSIAVEEFVEGHEGFYDTITIDGEAAADFISHYYPNVLPAMRDRRVSPQIAATNRVGLPSYDELREMGRRVVHALGIGTAATHMEWFFGPKGLKFSEIGCRPPGERIWDLYCVGNEVDLYREWAHAMTRGRIATRPSRRFATGSVQIRPERDGKVTGYSGLDEVWRRCKEWIIASEVPRPGSSTVPIAKGYLCNTWFRLRHPDYDELRRMMDFIGSTVKMHAA